MCVCVQVERLDDFDLDLTVVDGVIDVTNVTVPTSPPPSSFSVSVSVSVSVSLCNERNELNVSDLCVW